MKGILPLFIILLFFISCSEKPGEIKTPAFLGRPPQNAYTGLVKLDRGEIRHYGKNMFIRSVDQGLTWDTVKVSDGNLYGKKSPVTGEFMRLYAGKDDAVFSARSQGGIDGKWITQKIDSNGAIMLKPAVFIRGGKRAIVGFHTKHRNGSGTYYSDDHGVSWKKSNEVNAPPHEAGGFHQGPRWNHGAVEPSVIELKDGRLWMIMRTARDFHYESISDDGGETWSKTKPSPFYGTITMPTIQRLSNGKILILWCNTTPLPEGKHASGIWEDVFTNRDAIHAAISDDEGQTWRGFREIYLNPLRNDSLMATRYGRQRSLDRSVHQSEFVEIDDNNILISLGQHPEFRALIKMDTRWLFEKERSDNFSNGLENWSVQKYIKGIRGHCAYNRKPGAELTKISADSRNQAMHLFAVRDTSLLVQNSGAAFNFPSGNSGEVKLDVLFNSGFEGMNIGLHDRWFNPVDTVAKYYAMHHVEIPTSLLIGQHSMQIEKWQELKFIWHHANRLSDGVCELLINNQTVKKLPLLNKSTHGISYIHFNMPLSGDRNNGVLIRSIEAKVK